MEQESIITNHPVFQSLNEQTIQQVIEAANPKVYKKGDFLVHQGEVWPFLFLLKEGKIVAEKDSAEGRTLTATTLFPGDLFWGLAFFLEDSPMPAALRILNDAKVIIWSRRDLLPILKNNGEFSWELGKLVVQRMLEASEILESMTFQPNTVRLARLLLGISKSGQQNPIERNLTRIDSQLILL
ncbi:MAG: Crp/Fnr family transcriptional regulator [Chloroflexi bacterium]|nr:Crp/Fnr family transcriptional regulator [Chloroflexota bacterium]